MLMSVRVGLLQPALVLCACPAPAGDSPAADGSSTDSVGTQGSSSGTTSTSTTAVDNGSSSTTAPEDACPPVEEWLRRSEYLYLPDESALPAGDQALNCSITRTLSADEVESVLPFETLGGVELECDTEDAGPTSIHMTAGSAAALDSLAGWVGAVDLQLLFEYGGGGQGMGEPFYYHADRFSLRDDVGPIVWSSNATCSADEPNEFDCRTFFPPGSVTSDWVAPLSEPQLEDVGCGTRIWEQRDGVFGDFEMLRLALAFETDEGTVHAIDKTTASIVIGGLSYEVFVPEAVGESADPAIYGGTSSYNHSVRVLLVRSPPS